MTSRRSSRSWVSRAERDPTDTRQLVDQLGDGVGDADPDRGDVVQIDPRDGLRRQGDDRCVAQQQRCDVGEQVGSNVVEALVRPDAAGDAGRGTLAQRPEHRRDVLERLAVEQPGEEQITFLPQGQLVVEVDVGGAGKQPAGLELDERGGDQQELRGDVEVERLHPFDLGEVGVDDARQADLVEVHLLGEDELQEQVERTFVDRSFDTGRHGCVRRYRTACGRLADGRTRPVGASGDSVA